MLAAGHTPDAWQREVASGAGDTVVVTARQCGKSGAAAALVAGQLASDPNARILLIAPAQRQSRMLLDRVRFYLDNVPHPEFVNATQSEVRLASGAVCWAVPASASTIRGYDRISLLIADESAWVPEHVVAAVLPMLAHARARSDGVGGRFIALSTPGSAEGWYYRAVQDPEGNGFRLVSVPHDRVPRLAPAFVERMRSRLPGPVFRAEYECSFEVAAGALFDQVALARAERVEPMSGLPSPREWMRERGVPL